MENSFLKYLADEKRPYAGIERFERKVKPKIIEQLPFAYTGIEKPKDVKTQDGKAMVSTPETKEPVKESPWKRFPINAIFDNGRVSSFNS
jgi:hypothetical protein